MTREQAMSEICKILLEFEIELQAEQKAGCVTRQDESQPAQEPSQNKLTRRGNDTPRRDAGQTRERVK